MLSGDRHVAGIYRQAGAAPYTLNEMTTSSLNVPVTTDDSEWSPAQVGRIYTPVNFGLVEIDWTGRKVALSVRDLTGAPQRSLTVPFSEIGI
jgi:alkaline phosphatase D